MAASLKSRCERQKTKIVPISHTTHQKLPRQDTAKLNHLTSKEWESSLPYYGPHVEGHISRNDTMRPHSRDHPKYVVVVHKVATLGLIYNISLHTKYTQSKT